MDEFSMQMSDNASDDMLQKERQKLFSLIHGQNHYFAWMILAYFRLIC